MNKKRLFKSILALVLIIAITSGSFYGYHKLLAQDEAVINDRTKTEEAPSDKKSGNSDDDDSEPTITLSEFVETYSDEQTEQINDSIKRIQTYNSKVEIIVDNTSPEEFRTMAPGDIFMLEGDASTPFGETYIGKISNIQEIDGGYLITTTAPTIDEAFSEFNVDFSETLSPDKITTIKAVEGVTIGSAPTTLADASGDSSIIHVSDDPNKPLELPLPGKQYGLTIDLLKLLKLAGKAHSNTRPAGYDANQAAAIANAAANVAENITGDSDTSNINNSTDSASDNSPQDSNDSSGNNSSQNSGDSSGDNSSQNPGDSSGSNSPQDSDDSSGNDSSQDSNTENPEKETWEKELTLTGTLTLSDLLLTADIDLNKENLHIEDFYVNVEGHINAQLALEGNISVSLGGDDSELTLANFIKLQGLPEKSYPLLYIGYDLVKVEFAVGKKTTDSYLKRTPLSAGIMLYMDLSGEISFSLQLIGGLDYSFDAGVTFVEDGKWHIDPHYEEKEFSPSWSFAAGVSADMDMHVGVSAMLFVFNLNVADVGILKYGAEAQGKFEITASDKNKPKLDAPFAYLRMYLKIGDIKAKLSANIELFDGIVSKELGFEWGLCLADITLFDPWKRLDTTYSPSTMSYMDIFAKDSESIYYKAEDGKLYKKTNGFSDELIDEFEYIVGIDASYIYVINGDSALCRVNKKDGSLRELVPNVSNVYFMDNHYIYYTLQFNTSQLSYINRETLSTGLISGFNGSIINMYSIDNSYFVVTQIKMILGSNYNYFVLDYTGADSGIPNANPLSITKRYDFDDLPVSCYARAEINNGYYKASKPLGTNRYITGTVHIMSPDKVIIGNIDYDGIIKSRKTGLLISRDENSTSEDGITTTSHRVIKVNTDLSETTLQYVNNVELALSTFLLLPNGSSYCFDNADDGSICLYYSSGNAGNRSVIKTFTKDELSDSISATANTYEYDGCCYFYSYDTHEVYFRFNYN